MVAKKKGAGGNLARSQVVTVRLDPKLKFAAELAARRQRRTLSSFIEWAVEGGVGSVEVTPNVYIDTVIERIWDVEEADRLVKLAINFPALLTFDEERLWKMISENPYFWYRDWDHGGGWNSKNENCINYENLRSQWTTLNKIIAGEATTSDLPKEVLNEPPSMGDDVPF